MIMTKILIYPVITFFIVAGIVLMYTNFEKKKSNNVQSGIPKENTFSIVPENGIGNTGNLKTYKNEKYHFEFKYPDNYAVSETTDFKGLYEEKIALQKIVVSDKSKIANNTLDRVEFWVYKKDTLDLKSWVEKHSPSLSIAAFEGNKITSKDIVFKDGSRQVVLSKQSGNGSSGYDMLITSKANFVYALVGNSSSQVNKDIFSSFEFIE